MANNQALSSHGKQQHTTNKTGELQHALKSTESDIELLLESCSEGRVDVVHSFLTKQEDPERLINARADNGATPLILASVFGHEKVVDCLLNHGDEMVRSKDGLIAMVAACKNGHYKVVKAFLDNGADVNATALMVSRRLGEGKTKLLVDRDRDDKSDDNDNRNDDDDIQIRFWDVESGSIVKRYNFLGSRLEQMCKRMTVLMLASMNGHRRIVELFLSRGANPNDPIGDEDERTTILICESGKGNEGMVKTLIEHRADVNARNGVGRTALMEASENGHEEIVKILLENGADVNVSCGGDGTIVTALMSACSGGHARVVGILAQHGADVNASDEERMTSLMRACVLGYHGAVEVLIEAGADVNAKDRDGVTALMRVYQSGNKDILEKLTNEQGGAMLVQKGGDVTTPFLWACENGVDEMVRELMLVDAQACVNARDAHGVTALMKACSHGHDVIVTMLVQNGADVNSCDNEGYSPLMNAVVSQRVQVVRVLIQQGALVNARDAEEHTTALILACCLPGNVEVVKCLMEHGADANLKDINGKTALMAARERGDDDLVQELPKSVASLSI